MIIAIDGPSGAGKSTLGKMLASELGLLYLDTGAMYRAAALVIADRDIKSNSSALSAEVVRESNITLTGEADNLHVFLNEADVTEAIRTPEISQLASFYSAIPEVRLVLVERQRELAEENTIGCVLDGRDIGTVVFPNADVKFYLNARTEARARRRFEEDTAKGANVTYEATLADIIQRDTRDTTRADSPLSKAHDAIEIDTSEKPIREVFNEMLGIINAKKRQKFGNLA